MAAFHFIIVYKYVCTARDFDFDLELLLKQFVPCYFLFCILNYHFFCLWEWTACWYSPLRVSGITTTSLYPFLCYLRRYLFVLITGNNPTINGVILTEIYILFFKNNVTIYQEYHCKSSSNYYSEIFWYFNSTWNDKTCDG